MNLSVFSGRLCTVPKLSVIQLEDSAICACKYTIAVCDGLTDYNEEEHYDANDVDFFECIAFEEAAQMINNSFVKGSKILCRGKMKNHRFEDANRTTHFTNIFLTQCAEFGDTDSGIRKTSGKKRPIEMSVVADLKQLEYLYKKVCESGFLCLDESDYYNIAMMNM